MEENDTNEWKNNADCFYCGKKGHIKNEYPELQDMEGQETKDKEESKASQRRRIRKQKRAQRKLPSPKWTLKIQMTKTMNLSLVSECAT